jgi:hypothetical protein
MTFTTITLRRHGETLGNPLCLPFAGRWLADAERKAMETAERMSLFPYATDVRILCESENGKAASLCWLLARPAEPLPPKVFV